MSQYKNRWGERKQGRRVFKHKVLGRKVNVVATQVMADYLQEVIERLLREHVGGDPSQYFTHYAHSFREGVVDRLYLKLATKRREMEQEEERKARENAAASRHLSAAPTAPGTGLVTYTQSEYGANIDVIYGEGTSARWAAERYQAEQEAKKKREEQAKWELEHPEEAAALRAKEEAEYQEWAKKQRRSSWNAGTGRGKRDHSGYRAGYAAGADVSLDPQIRRDRNKQIR